MTTIPGLRHVVKARILGFRPTRRVYGYAHELWFEHNYRARRERYERAAPADASSRAAHVRRALARIAARGYVPAPRAIGEVHTFAFIPGNWSHQNQIAAALQSVGPCSRFDYTREGFTLHELRSAVPGCAERKRRMLELAWARFVQAHAERPVDWFFSYALPWDMSAELLQRVRDHAGVPTVNISLDDKNWWDEIERGDRASGMVHLSPHYDLSWTSARVVLPWHWAEGGQAIFLPEGVNTEHFRPLDVEPDIDVGFVGNRFGYREDVLETLRRAGISLVVRGPGWPEGTLGDDEMLRFFNRCRLNLGLGEMHYSRWLTNLKGRDFEIPATGRGMYLTSYNSDLATCFDIGREIQCYRGIDEMIELIRAYLRQPEEAARVAGTARERCVREHQWRHRYHDVLGCLGILEAPQPAADGAARGRAAEPSGGADARS